MECPHCGAEALMGAATCVSCGESMFSMPGGAGASRRPTTNPAPWRDTGTHDAPLEHRRIGGAPPPDSGPALPSTPGARPSIVSNDGPGSDTFQKQWQRETVPEFPRLQAAPPSAVDDTGDAGDADTDTGTASAEGELPAAMPAPVELPRRGRRSICTICFGPKNDALSDVCDECGDRASGSYDAATGRATIKPRKVQKRRGGMVRRAVAAVFWGALLVVAGMAIVKYADRHVPGMGLIKGTQAEPVEVGFAIPDMGATDFHTAVDLQITRVHSPKALASGNDIVFDVHQVAGHASRVTLLESRADAAVLNVRTETTLELQDGEVTDDDGVAETVYPWDGHLQVSRVYAPAHGAIAYADGRVPLAARDLPPFLTFGSTGAPRGQLTVGRAWQASVELPCVAGMRGKLGPYPFDCAFEYAGRRVVDGRPCAIVQLTATADGEADRRLHGVDGVGGTVAGALAFDIDTGLLVSADLEVEMRVVEGTLDDPIESVTTSGSVGIARTKP